MDVPAWANRGLSNDLPLMVSRGEGQSQEFKISFPPQARDLAKEIAAFATSNDGLVLLGVADNGAIVGLGGAEASTARDALIERVVGVCRLIDPPVRPDFHWAVVESKVVLAIDVKKGREPIYYADHRPILRHGATSRPANASEVVDAIARFLGVPSKQEPSDSQQLLWDTAEALSTGIAWSALDLNFLCVEPAVDEWSAVAGALAKRLRTFAVEDTAVALGIVDQLRTVADAFESVAGFVHTLGGGADFSVTVAEARASAMSLMAVCESRLVVGPTVARQLLQETVKARRMLEDAWSRASSAERIVSGGVDEAQERSGEIGRLVSQWGHLPIRHWSREARESLVRIGAKLMYLGARTMYYDGGQSQRDAVSDGLALAKELEDLVAAVGKDLPT